MSYLVNCFLKNESKKEKKVSFHGTEKADNNYRKTYKKIRK